MDHILELGDMKTGRNVAPSQTKCSDKGSASVKQSLMLEPHQLGVPKSRRGWNSPSQRKDLKTAQNSRSPLSELTLRSSS